jgi:uncharacterized membrane protein
MAAFPFFRKPDFFSEDEKQRIITTIREAERQTSGEIRVFIESRCRFVNALDRAAEIFWGLKMDQTQQHNAVLVYVAVRDHQYAVFADDGIHKKLGDTFWNEEVKAMYKHFKQNQVSDAVAQVITDVGKALALNFPYQNHADKNELPDDIVFGK